MFILTEKQSIFKINCKRTFFMFISNEALLLSTSIVLLNTELQFDMYLTTHVQISWIV